LPYTRLRRSSSIAATSSTMACLSSGIVMIRLRSQRSFMNPHRKKSGTVRSGDRAGQAMSPKRFVITTNTGNTVLHVPMLHCSWPYEVASSLLPFPFGQPRQAITQAQYSNVKCVSRSAPPCTCNLQLQSKLTISNGKIKMVLCKRWRSIGRILIPMHSFVNLGISVRWAIDFTFRVIYPQEKLSVLMEWEAE
jgi:hypothetical protein